MDEYHPSLIAAADAAAQFIRDMEAGRPPYWLTLSGAPGNGKTMLMRQLYERALPLCGAATANHPLQFGIYDERRRRPGCRWTSATKVADLYLGDRQYDLPEYLAVEWLLALDDLGAESDRKDLLAPVYYRLLNGRLGKWTLFTMNFTLEEVSRKIDARVSSRLIRDDNRLVTITAPDYALRPRR